MKKLLFIVFLALQGPVGAVELLGVRLETTQRDDFRQAVKKAGVTLISEAGKDGFFDSYESAGLLQGSSRLLLGFVKKDNRFAFAEYELVGLQQTRLLEKLVAKYGPYQLIKGDYLTDSGYQWQKESIQITLTSDWINYRSRLIYSQPQALNTLRQEYLSFQRQQQLSPEENQYNAY